MPKWRDARQPGLPSVDACGPGGIGKSRLAVEAARRTVGEGELRTPLLFLHGVTFVSLAGLESAALLLPTLAGVLGLSLHTAVPHQAQLLGFLEEKELLLVLDNYEPLLPDTALLATLLAAVPTMKILVTSRERLNLQRGVAF